MKVIAHAFPRVCTHTHLRLAHILDILSKYILFYISVQLISFVTKSIVLNLNWVITNVFIAGSLWYLHTFYWQ